MSEFKITGPGEYRTRDGRKAIVTKIVKGALFPVIGKVCGEEMRGAWPITGHTGEGNLDDIIGPWVEPAAKPKPQHGADKPVKALRDEYAMAALTGLLAYNGQWAEGAVSLQAYEYADAMLAARQKGQ